MSISPLRRLGRLVSWPGTKVKGQLFKLLIYPQGFLKALLYGQVVFHYHQEMPRVLIPFVCGESAEAKTMQEKVRAVLTEHKTRCSCLCPGPTQTTTCFRGRPAILGQLVATAGALGNGCARELHHLGRGSCLGQRQLP